MRPADNPFEAADSLCEALSKGQPHEQRLRDHLRMQAWLMVCHLLTRDGPEDRWDRSRATGDDLKAEVTRVRIRWDAGCQEYDLPSDQAR